MDLFQNRVDALHQSKLAMPLVLILSLGFVLLPLLRFVRSHGQRPALCPPGPPTLPIIGNAHIFPRSRLEEAFSTWAYRYGDVFSLKVMNQNIIVLNTPSVMKDVLVKNTSVTSHRPVSTIMNIISPKGLNFGTVHETGELWKTMRTASQQLLTSKNFRPFLGILQAEATQMVMDLLLNPTDFMEHAERFTVSFAMAIMYGVRGVQASSPFVRQAITTNRRFLAAMDILAAPPVDVFPILKYVPRFLASWKREAQAVCHLQQSLYTELLKEVKARLARGEGNDSFVEQAIRNAEAWGLKDDEWLANFGGALFEGSQTAAGAIQSLMVSAVAYPEKQALVAKELEEVIGPDRVPRLGDIDRLPYTRAFMKESQRLYPIAPIGIPHEMNEDAMINGHLYPKGSTVFQNTWHMYRDERYFDRPNEFIPERFLNNIHGTKPGVEDDPARNENLLFGGGRRMCPGLNVAKAELDTIGPYILWAFDFKPARDPKTGLEVPLHVEHKSGVAALPLPIKCSIKPRSQHRETVIRREFQQVGDELRKYEVDITEKDACYNKTYRDL